MSIPETIPPPDQTAASERSGCLSGFALPPLAVLLVSLVMGFVFLGGHTPGPPAVAAGSLSAAGAGPSQPTLAGLFTPQVQFWADSIQAWSQQAGLDPNLVATVMQIESCGNPLARSSAGAEGLFQVMPGHFLPTDHPTDPSTNAQRGLAYLKRSLQAASGDARLALAGYNGGLSVIALSESSWADETRRYAYWGSGIYADAAQGSPASSRLQEWLAAGGAGMCRQAQRVLAGIP